MGLLSGFLGDYVRRFRADDPPAQPGQIEIWEGRSAIVTSPAGITVIPFLDLFPEGTSNGTSASELTFEQLRPHVPGLRRPEDLEEVAVENGWIRRDGGSAEWSVPVASLAQLTADDDMTPLDANDEAAIDDDDDDDDSVYDSTDYNPRFVGDD
jgi:hypothetical protein